MKLLQRLPQRGGPRQIGLGARERGDVAAQDLAKLAAELAGSAQDNNSHPALNYTKAGKKESPLRVAGLSDIAARGLALDGVTRAQKRTWLS
jgi:hypothetical protein